LSDCEDTFIETKVDSRKCSEDNENLKSENDDTDESVDKNDEERGDEETSSYHYNSNGRYSRAGSTSSAISSSNGATPMSRLINGSKISDSNEHLNIDDNPRELKKKLNEIEERYKKHAMYQTQLENDNQKLIYEVDSLKDVIEDYEELIVELKRQYKEKNREVENQKRQNKDLSVDFERLKVILKQRDDLIENSGLILYTDDENREVALQQVKSILPAALLSPETATLLDSLGDGTIDDKLRKLLDDKGKFREQINKLNSDLEDEKFKCSQLERKLQQSISKLSDTKDSSLELQEMQRNYNKEINELKLKAQRLEHDNFLLKEEKARVETQIKNLQRNLEEMSGKESNLEKEKRDLRRELNEANSKINDLQTKVDVLRRTQRTRQTNLLSNRINLASTPTSSSTNLQATASTSASASTTSSTAPLANTALILPIGSSSSSTAPSSAHTSPLLSFNYEPIGAVNTSLEKHDESDSSHRDDSLTLNSNTNSHVNNIIDTSGNMNENQNTSDTNDDEKNNSNTSDSTNSSSTN